MASTNSLGFGGQAACMEIYPWHTLLQPSSMKHGHELDEDVSGIDIDEGSAMHWVVSLEGNYCSTEDAFNHFV